MNNSLEQANNLLNYYEEKVIELRKEFNKLSLIVITIGLFFLDMYMYLRYTFKLVDLQSNTDTILQR